MRSNHPFFTRCASNRLASAEERGCKRQRCRRQDRSHAHAATPVKRAGETPLFVPRSGQSPQAAIQRADPLGHGSVQVERDVSMPCEVSNRRTVCLMERGRFRASNPRRVGGSGQRPERGIWNSPRWPAAGARSAVWSRFCRDKNTSCYPSLSEFCHNSSVFAIFFT